MLMFIVPPESVRYAETQYAIEPSLAAEGNEGRTVDARSKSISKTAKIIFWQHSPGPTT